MKRLIVVGVLLVLIVSVCITGQAVVKSSGDKISALLEQGMTAAESGDLEGARKKAEQAESAFVRDEFWLEIFVHRDLIENLGVQLSRLSHLAAEETLPEYCSEADGAIVMLTHVVSGERPTFKREY